MCAEDRAKFVINRGDVRELRGESVRGESVRGEDERGCDSVQQSCERRPSFSPWRLLFPFSRDEVLGLAWGQGLESLT